MDSTTKIREAFVGWTVVGVEPYGREGGLRFSLTNGQSVTRVVGVYPGSEGGLHLGEVKEGPASGEMLWTDFRAMTNDLVLHSCLAEDARLESSDEPRLRAVGFSCTGCGNLWRIGITKLRASDHLWTKAMREPAHREYLMRHLETLGLQTESVPAEWRAFFQGKSEFPG